MSDEQGRTLNSPTEHFKMEFQSIPNFRLLPNTQNVYRSSHLGHVSQQEIQTLLDLDIKCVIDLRTSYEITDSTSTGFVDKFYSLAAVPESDKTSPTSDPESSATASATKVGIDDNGKDVQKKGRLYHADIMTMDVITHIVKEKGLLLKLNILFYNLVDRALKTTYRIKHIKQVILETGMLAMYKMFIRHSGHGFVSALRLLKDRNNYPYLFYCNLGKDRTGVLAALILWIMGASKDQIAKDYSLSQPALLANCDQLDTYQQSFVKEKISGESNPQTMLDLLSFIEEQYGSLEDYLVNHGLTTEEQSLIRNNLTS